MRRFKSILSRFLSADVLQWVYPLVLIAPNIGLDITETYPLFVKILNVLLPAGVYLLLTALSPLTGRTVVLALPLTVLAAFQVVLLFLYGESIIAVDMFLNVVTTNVSEATELLGNLTGAIFTVIGLYLTTLVWGIVLWSRRCRVAASNLKVARRSASGLLTAALVAYVACLTAVPQFRLVRDIFPLNVVRNMWTAVERTRATEAYAETSAAFDYHPAATRPDSVRQVYVLVVGETSRADNWQLLGSPRPTNPHLSRRSNLVVYPYALTESNTTHKSVPLMLSHVTAETFNDSIYSTKSIVSAFGQAGFNTAWLSNQARNRSFIEFFAREADSTLYISDDRRAHYDTDLVEPLRRIIEADTTGRLFVVLHTYGGHFNYVDRYPAEAARFKPDHAFAADASERNILLNAFDNTVCFTDSLLDAVIGTVERTGGLGAVLYCSDHGEDIYDDPRGRFLHASPVPTYYQLHVPMLIWMSDGLRVSCPELYANVQRNSGKQVSSSRDIFDTMLSLAGLETPYADPRNDLTSVRYTEHPRIYLTDHNEAVPLKSAGLRQYDFDFLARKNISAE